MKYTAKEVAALVGGTVHGDATRVLTEAVNDTRRLPADGGLFVALAGSRADGHDFVAAAAKTGAAAALVCRERVADLSDAGLTLIAVEDVETALWTLADSHRQAYEGPVVALTGSFGKTTTKNMLAAILEASLGRGCATRGNMNNLLGVPLTLTRLNLDDAWLVLELGSNAPGEIAKLAGLARPDVAVVTGVAAAHLEGFGDLRGVLEEKASLPRALGKDGVAVFAGDCELLADDSGEWPGRKVPVGGNAADTVRIASRQEGEQAGGALVCGDERASLTLPVCGAFNVDNAALAVAAAMALDVPFAQAVAAVETFQPEGMRMETRRISDVCFVVDAYNANPESMKAAIRTLRGLPGKRCAVVLGTMLELGGQAGRLHANVGRFAARAGLDFIVVVGEFAEDYLEGMAGYECAAVSASDAAEAGEILADWCRAGDVVLLKGSRGARVEAVLDRFREVTD